MIEKSANRLWKESNTTLSFKDWLNREKTKFINFNGGVAKTMIVNKPLNKEIGDTISEIRKSVGYKTESKNKSVFGINQNLLIISGIVLVAFVTYKIVKKKQ